MSSGRVGLAQRPAQVLDLGVAAHKDLDRGAANCLCPPTLSVGPAPRPAKCVSRVDLCQICDRLKPIPDHFRAFQRTRPSGASCSTSNSYAHLHGPGDRTENPGVGGSIPSLPTMIFPSDVD